MPSAEDGRHRTLTLDRPPTRIVSLVPSLTEALATISLGPALVGVTRYCAEPAELVTRLRKVGGTKDPGLDLIRSLEPEIVVANEEENRREDVEALEAAGLQVWVGTARSVLAAVEELDRLATLLGAARSAARLLTRARDAIAAQEQLNTERPRVSVFCPIWRNPYMAVGGDTYAGNLLRFCGAVNGFETHRTGNRYPQVTLDDIRAADPAVILLPDEPFRFRERHRQEVMETLPQVRAVREGNVFLLDGRWLTWYGKRIPDGLQEIAALLDQARPEWEPPAAFGDAAKIANTLPAPPLTPSATTPPEPPPARQTPAALPPGLRFTVESQETVDRS